MKEEDLPKKVSTLDVAPFIKTKAGKLLTNSILTQKEYDYVQKYIKRHHPRNVKLSRKDPEHHLANSVIFDEKGHAFVLYRGKSMQAQTQQWLDGIEAHTLSEKMQEDLEVLKSRPDFAEEKLLGEGAYGRVKLCQSLETGEWLAVKILETSAKSQKHISKEAEINRERGFLIRFERFKAQAKRKDEKEKQYLFQSLINGVSLSKYAQRVFSHHRSDDPFLMDVALNTIQAVMDCHSRGILHRDIKPENLLVNPKTFEVTLIDFGLSVQLKAGHLRAESPSSMGSLAYLPRELRMYHASYLFDERTEAYALGQVLGQLILGHDFTRPFTDYSDEELKTLGFKRSDFLHPDAPALDDRSNTSLQAEWGLEDTIDPMSRPLARRCIEAFERVKAGTGEASPIAVMIGSLCHHEVSNRPSLLNVKTQWQAYMMQQFGHPLTDKTHVRLKT